MENKLTKKHKSFDRIKAKRAEAEKSAKTRAREVEKRLKKEAQ